MDFSIDQAASPTGLNKDFLSRATGNNKLLEHINPNNISRITGGTKVLMNDMSNFCDDSKLMDILNNENIFEEIQMGQYDEEDK